MALLSAIAKITLDKTGFDASLNAAGKQFEQFGKGLRNQLAGAFGAAAVVAFSKQLVQSSMRAGEAIGDLSDRLGISIKDAQELALASKLGGAGVDFLATKFEKLRDFMIGGGTLEGFGISTGDPVQALTELANIIQTTGLDAEQSNKFVEIFGKGSGKLITVLGDMKMAKDAIKFSDEDVRSAQKFSDQMVLIGNALDVYAGKYIRFAQKYSLAGLLSGGDGGGGSGRTVDTSAAAKAEAERAAKLKEQEEFAKGWMAIQDRILGLERETMDITERTRRAKLTDAERLLEIKQEESELQKKIDLEVPVTEEGIFREKYYEMQKRLAELGLERGQLEGRAKVPGSSAISSDAFQRIGAFTGASAQSAQLDVARQQLNALERLRDELTRRGIIIRGTD